MQLGEILLRRKLISPQQLEEALTEQHAKSRRLGELLLEQTIISENDLSSSLQEQYWRRHGFWILG